MTGEPVTPAAREYRPLVDDDERECDRCGDNVQTLSSQDLCDGCVEEDAAKTASLEAPPTVPASLLGRNFPTQLDNLAKPANVVTTNHRAKDTKCAFIPTPSPTSPSVTP